MVTSSGIDSATASGTRASVVFITGDPIDLTTPIEPSNGFDPRVDKGTIADVCFANGRTEDDVKSARLLPGAQALSSYLYSVFSWAARGTAGQCRELLLSSTNNNCDGDIYPDPRPGVPNPPLHFYSDCWSNHAQGRALDFRVGGTELPMRQRIARGTLLIEWLLAPDAQGNKQARARRLGIQEILFFDRCWNNDKPDALDKSTYLELEECDIGHYDHVHLSFNVAGALGLTSGYDSDAPPPPPHCAGCTPNIRPRM
ncbi:MAG: hypothetical protein ABL953_08650 [Ilumatobacteraceae bacterium]